VIELVDIETVELDVELVVCEVEDELELDVV
jgi:hypothetical protein